jgi:S1-C subfamily serine protease
MIQMTAPVQPGDCGGYVADSSGRFIGLVHSVYAPDPAGGDLAEKFGKAARDLLASGARTVSFATPSDWVRFSADRIIKHGRMVRGWLGLSARPLDEASRAQLGLPEAEGAEVVRVDRDGPAARARLAPRDVLLTFDGQPIKDLDELQWKVARIEEPKTVKVTFLRNRERHEADLRVELDPQK